jgi:hypothetical protein
MTSTCTSPHCEYPTPEGAFICKICVQQLRRDLGGVPALIEDLHTTLSRQDKLGASGGRRGGETALPFKPTASEALWVLINTVVVWARSLDTQPVPDAPAAAARWLLLNVNTAAAHPDAGQLVDEIASAVQKAYDVIDRPPDLLLAGQCGDEGCDEYLYANPDATYATCRGCGAEHSVEERRAWMVTAASHLSLPAVTCLSWVKQLMGKQIPRGTWDSWVARGRIAVHERDHAGNALYRFGDVRDLAAEWVARPRSTKGTAA